MLLLLSAKFFALLLGAIPVLYFLFDKKRMSDFGVSHVLPNLTPAEVQKVVDFLRNDMGVDDDSFLAEVEENDFLEADILGKAPARRLLKYWETGLCSCQKIILICSKLHLNTHTAGPNLGRPEPPDRGGSPFGGPQLH